MLRAFVLRIGLRQRGGRSAPAEYKSTANASEASFAQNKAAASRRTPRGPETGP